VVGVSARMRLVAAWFADEAARERGEEMFRRVILACDLAAGPRCCAGAALADAGGRGTVHHHYARPQRRAVSDPRRSLYGRAGTFRATAANEVFHVTYFSDE